MFIFCSARNSSQVHGNGLISVSYRLHDRLVFRFHPTCSCYFHVLHRKYVQIHLAIRERQPFPTKYKLYRLILRLQLATVHSLCLPSLHILPHTHRLPLSSHAYGVRATLGDYSKLAVRSYTSRMPRETLLIV